MENTTIYINPIIRRANLGMGNGTNNQEKGKKRDYSLDAFRKLPSTEQEEYFKLAVKRNPEYVESKKIIEVVAENIWMAEMERAEGG